MPVWMEWFIVFVVVCFLAPILFVGLYSIVQERNRDERARKILEKHEKQG